MLSFLALGKRSCNLILCHFCPYREDVSARIFPLWFKRSAFHHPSSDLTDRLRLPLQKISKGQLLMIYNDALLCATFSCGLFKASFPVATTQLTTFFRGDQIRSMKSVSYFHVKINGDNHALFISRN